jgi:hypothetical protein
MNSLQKTEAELRALPRAPSSDPVGEVLHVLSSFSRDLSRRLEGTSDADGLLQTIRPCQEAFKRAIRRTAPNFIPWEKTQKSRELPEPRFLANEEGDDEDSDEESDDESEHEHEHKIYIDEVFKRAQRYVFSLVRTCTQHAKTRINFVSAHELVSFLITTLSLYRRSTSSNLPSNGDNPPWTSLTASTRFLKRTSQS